MKYLLNGLVRTPRFAATGCATGPLADLRRSSTAEIPSPGDDHEVIRDFPSQVLDAHEHVLDVDEKVLDGLPRANYDHDGDEDAELVVCLLDVQGFLLQREGLQLEIVPRFLKRPGREVVCWSVWERHVA
jgi:hypothetical protein